MSTLVTFMEGSCFAPVNILLRNQRNCEQVDYSNFQVDTLSEIIALLSVPLQVSPKEENQIPA